jgi:phosphinothricin acetyltransferase
LKTAGNLPAARARRSLRITDSRPQVPHFSAQASLPRVTRNALPIRIAAPGDAEQILRIYRPFVTESAVSFELEVPSSTEMADRIQHTLIRTPWLVCHNQGLVAGYAYATAHRERKAYQWSVEVSAYVEPDTRRAGIARALYSRLFEILSLQGYFNAFAGITLPNAASQRFHEALGFSMIGVYHNIGFKLGRWHDVVWYERALQPHSPDPSPPMPFSDAAIQRRAADLLGK